MRQEEKREERERWAGGGEEGSIQKEGEGEGEKKGKMIILH